AKENVHRVTAVDVSDRAIGRLLHHSCSFTGEGVGHTGTQGNQCYGSDGVLQTNKAPKDASKISYDGCHEIKSSKEADRIMAWVVNLTYHTHNGTHTGTYLPEEREEVEDVVEERSRCDVSTVDIHGLHELLHVGRLLKFKGVQVGFCHVQDAAHKAIE
ncbi:hypothetical protein EGW08_021751, partial [Elysia chlorotica]